ncbi:MAG: amidohydrolase family protein [Nitrospinae bacterium]|nr:amidohydrolase family protein [Nitrospinota bacterium]
MNVKILSADWVLPVSSEPIKKGAIAVINNLIEDVDCQENIVQKYPGAFIEVYEGKVILPGFINSHTHLDFSLYQNQLKMKNNETFFDWIDRVISLQPKTTLEMRKKGAVEGVKQITMSQTAVVGDITHNPFSCTMLQESGLSGVCFHELSGFLPEMAESLMNAACEAIKEISTSNFNHVVVPHSPYAVSEKLLKMLGKKGGLTSFHLAESKDETTFLLKGEAKMKKIMEGLGKWNRNWKPPKVSPVKYFFDLGLLHEKSLAVHMVEVKEKDYPLLEQSKTNICLCPRSNLWLKNGLPPAKDYIDLGLNVCLGTDGLGSNDDLNIINEMKAFKKFFPEIPDKTIVEMTTINSAKSLELQKNFGSLEKGKKPSFAFMDILDKENPYSFF